MRRNGDKPRALVKEVFSLNHPNVAVSGADHVFIALPLNDVTKGCFNSRIFAAMKRGAGLYSPARGAHLVEPDLVDALESGQVGFAGLDGFTEEPLPPENPRWTAPNVPITPHCSGRSEHEFRRMSKLVIDNLERFRSGRELRNVVLKNF